MEDRHRYKSHSTLLKSALAACMFIPGVIWPTEEAFAIGELTCTANSQVTYSPGLLLFTQQTDITFDVAYGGCTSLTGSPITSGTRSGSFTGPRSCLALPPSASVVVEVTWNTGAVSVVNATAQSTDLGGQTVHLITGPIISGPFTGRTFNEQIVQASLDLTKCLFAPGITSQTGVGVIEVL